MPSKNGDEEREACEVCKCNHPFLGGLRILFFIFQELMNMRKNDVKI